MGKREEKSPFFCCSCTFFFFAVDVFVLIFFCFVCFVFLINLTPGKREVFVHEIPVDNINEIFNIFLQRKKKVKIQSQRISLSTLTKFSPFPLPSSPFPSHLSLPTNLLIIMVILTIRMLPHIKNKKRSQFFCDSDRVLGVGGAREKGVRGEKRGGGGERTGRGRGEEKEREGTNVIISILALSARTQT